MRSSILEARVLSLIDAVRAKRPVEDSLVELKTIWPVDVAKAARQLAGHCNAVHGEPVLWLIGVDEDGTVPGVNHTELSNWIQKIYGQFVDLSPRLILDLNIPIEGKTVVALLFDSERAPFLVRNPAFGKAGEVVQAEVPWRDGTGVRSARRKELLRILEPSQQLPDVKLRSISVSLMEFHIAEKGNKRFQLTIEAELYISPRQDSRVVFPYDDCQCTIAFKPSGQTFTMNSPEMRPKAHVRSIGFGQRGFENDMTRSQTIIESATELIIDGPGTVNLKGKLLREVDPVKLERDVEYTILLRAVHSPSPIVLVGHLHQDSEKTVADKHRVTMWRPVQVAID